MEWHVQHIRYGLDQLDWYLSPEQAVEAACRLIDDGHDVYALGAASLMESISRNEIARIYEMWVRDKRPFGEKPKAMIMR
jgi:hypothetical protein